MEWLLNNLDSVLRLTWQHLLLSVPAVLLSVLIAVPIGRLAYRLPRVGGALLVLTSLLYAIPALPLLILIPVIFGVPLRSGAVMVIGLTVYGVALLVRTSADAFSAVPAAARDAAMALGYSKTAMLWRVELPLAVPVLLSGVRVVTVSTIGLTTIGSLLGIPSLGSLLTDGFQRGIAAEVITGIAATLILALLCDALLLLCGRVLAPWQWRSRRSRCEAIESAEQSPVRSAIAGEGSAAPTDRGGACAGSVEHRGVPVNTADRGEAL
ncbi:ABC transporter permease [Leucobacter sp. OH1287]|uniref:ABC transporter permease n=1 Tax=Leucobacter sp. OH1287 TaxID=2491049 RepID=UPI000F6013FD|nr:ABC transporter permease subunit [Leucobacter sp. OH1287]RRD61306.1 ABC transporter permease subunit [Leucobacter sp. OH1287]